ncbi:hypothetical protein [Couchioplanes azureus]|uniref:hypothetical protein n=1 Tax=Couchioplanes caeruleus TaxID=56438 RepID=UPI0016709603|nr:hypothetical protein [Couchioplanes caeruleus]GGQ60900.1 hypothetical protein GCM10010166_33210 [Couchioplanes caeruleus subsp. azureus]
MSKSKNIVAAIGLGSLAALAIGSSAYAYGSGTLDLGDDKMRFKGSYTFNGTYRGGMKVSGTVCDTAADGNGVYGQGKILGYAWSSKVSDGNGSASGCGTESRTFSSNDVNFVSYGWYQICTDDWGSDTCDISSRLNR